jgi:hypothetical protein
MRRIGSIALALVLTAALPAAAEQWSKTYTLSGSPELQVDTSDANIHVHTWNQRSIEATVITSHYKIGPGGIQIDERQSGDRVEITVRFPHNFSTFGISHRVDIDIHMPRKGSVKLHTGDGQIELADFGGDIDLSSGDGAQTIHGVDGRLRATTGDGHITADGRFDALRLKTGDGHLDVRATAGSSVADEWMLETGDGNVSLEVPDNLAADLFLHTGDGHIEVNVPLTTKGKIRENDVRGKLNGGGKSLTIHTGDGSISMSKG